MRYHSYSSRLHRLAATACLLASGCDLGDEDTTPISYVCGTTTAAPVAADGGAARCGEGDPNLPLEPTLPASACQTLVADKSWPDEDNLDTKRIQAALTACRGQAVKLTVDPANPTNNTFVAAHLNVAGVTLWIDAGVTLYASRNADLYQKTGNCGVPGINDSGACQDFITVSGTLPAIVGDGIIDGQGGEPLLGHEYSWWELSGALREMDGSIGNPTLINVGSGTKGFVLYRVTLHNSPKFHVKISSNPPDGSCTTPGEGFTVWGVTVLTPSRWTNALGRLMSPAFARNTDGIDPGTSAATSCGVIACSTISTGDDNIAVKGGNGLKDLIIAHNHFGTGHGMSIGSETYGSVENVLVYDLTIDADSRWVGPDARGADFNGIRIKSDASRGGKVNNVTYRDICMRDMTNAILVSTAYNPLFAGDKYPEFTNVTFQNVRHVTCMGLQPPTVTVEGFSAALPAGPITFDNVVIDNIGLPGEKVTRPTIAAEFADIRLGPGDVNFWPSGAGVDLHDGRDGTSAPRHCEFPPLPVPEVPPGWLHGAPQ